MRTYFTAADLAEFDALLSSASAVVPMREIAAGNDDPSVIGLRHDVDDNPGSLETAVRLADWEAMGGYRSTYFVLHGSSYWADGAKLALALGSIADCGHEIGIHCNAIAESLRGAETPDAILTAALERLRGWGFDVRGVAPHGDPLCYGPDGKVRFVNDEIFEECARPHLGSPSRTIVEGDRRIRLAPRPLADYGLEYEAYRAGARRSTLSDSGGTWNVPPASLKLPDIGQLHILQHPDWWGGAL